MYDWSFRSEGVSYAHVIGVIWVWILHILKITLLHIGSMEFEICPGFPAKEVLIKDSTKLSCLESVHCFWSLIQENQAPKTVISKPLLYFNL